MTPILVAALLAAPQVQSPEESRPAVAAHGDPHAAKIAAKIDAKIAAMIQEISAVRLQRINRDLVGFHTRQVLSATDDPTKGTGAARTYLQKLYESFIPASQGRLTVERQEVEMPARRLGRTVKLVNIVATLKGTTDPGRIFVVGGHYDSINSNPRDAAGQAPGANDDGSGTCAVIEACRVMSKTGFAATIKFVAYDGEEQGLLGSEGHAKALDEAGAAVAGMITNDIVGNTLGMDGKRRRDYLRVFSYSPTGNDSPARNVARVAAYAAQRHVADFSIKLVYRGDRFGRGGDHKSFHARGVPAIRFTEPREDYSRQHQNVTERDGKPYGDLPEFVDFEYLAKVTAVNVATLAHLASAPPAPERVDARGARDAYDVDISWTPVDGAAGYEAVWRETTEADWTGVRTVEQPVQARRGLGYTLRGVCLDDCVVGIRAIGSDGSRSPATTPREPDSINQRQVGRRR